MSFQGSVSTELPAGLIFQKTSRGGCGCSLRPQAKRRRLLLLVRNAAPTWAASSPWLPATTRLPHRPTCLPHHRGSAALPSFPRLDPRLELGRWLEHLPDPEPLFIRLQTRQDPNYRTQSGAASPNDSSLFKRDLAPAKCT